MKKDVEFIWDTPQINAFKKIKQLIAESAALTYYDVNKPVTLQVDASKDGLGGCLLQEGKPVAYASASLTDTQTRYSQIEKEMLAVVFATKKFHHYIYGKKTKIHTDHKPLESIFKKNAMQSSTSFVKNASDTTKIQIRADMETRKRDAYC